MKKLIIEAIGWVGVALILGAFALNTFDVLQTNATAYNLMNLFGAIGVVISSLPKRNLQPIVINSVWFIVAAVGIFR